MPFDASRLTMTLDVNDPGASSWASWPPLMEWITDHGVDPTDVYRLEVRVFDTAFVRFYRYDRNDDGQKYVDKSRLPDIRAAVLPPLDVPMVRMCPVRTFGDG